jgi:tRNA pseudouridine13 synthase
MKLKQTPADFAVEEISDARPDSFGPFAFYRLRKTGWTTPDALQIVCRKFDVAWARLSYGGLKDRHAETIQYLTIDHGPQRPMSHERMDLTYLGQRREHYSSRNILANRFTITLRSLAADDVDPILQRCAEVDRMGVPNYFDDQRFGSVTADGRFIGRELVRGNFEEALKLALVEPYEFDRSETKTEKQVLRDHWNDWPTCKAKLPKGHARSLITYLCDHPTKFKGAIERLRPELQGMYLSAYQSELWNRILSRWIMANTTEAERGSVIQERGPMPIPLQLKPEVFEEWKQLSIPLPSPKAQLDPTTTLGQIFYGVLIEEELTLKKLKVQGLDRPFFSRGEREACLWPRGLKAEPGNDELNQGRKKLTLRFDLPRGAYATMVVKRLTNSQETTPVRE